MFFFPSFRNATNTNIKDLTQWWLLWISRNSRLVSRPMGEERPHLPVSAVLGFFFWHMKWQRLISSCIFMKLGNFKDCLVVMSFSLNDQPDHAIVSLLCLHVVYILAFKWLIIYHRELNLIFDRVKCIVYCPLHPWCLASAWPWLSLAHMCLCCVSLASVWASGAGAGVSVSLVAPMVTVTVAW